jgi:dUTP pyrophosphatase
MSKCLSNNGNCTCHKENLSVGDCPPSFNGDQNIYTDVYAGDSYLCDKYNLLESRALSKEEIDDLNIDLSSFFERIDNAYKVKCEVMEDGTLPCKKNQSDAGFDVFAPKDIIIEKGTVYQIPLNIRLHLPTDTYMEITSKSGLGLRGLLVFAGIIDQDYRGIPCVICTNLTDKPIEIKKGNKLAQGIMHPFSTRYEVEQVDKVDTNTDRGTGGFGSTGN